MPVVAEGVRRQVMHLGRMEFAMHPRSPRIR
jgi:hypothetical protein